MSNLSNLITGSEPLYENQLISVIETMSEKKRINHKSVLRHQVPDQEGQVVYPGTRSKGRIRDTGISGWIVFMFCLQPTRAEIIKPIGEWICNYCAMGNFLKLTLDINSVEHENNIFSYWV
jgi:hypothetical protein